MSLESDRSRPRPGSIGHVDFPATDLGRATEFYAGVFGWKVRTIPEFQGFALFDDGGIGGALNVRTTEADPGIRPYVTVTDMEATLAAIREHGGEILQEKTAIGEGNGFIARFRDPEGNGVGLWSET